MTTTARGITSAELRQPVLSLWTMFTIYEGVGRTESCLVEVESGENRMFTFWADPVAREGGVKAAPNKVAVSTDDEWAWLKSQDNGDSKCYLNKRAQNKPNQTNKKKKKRHQTAF